MNIYLRELRSGLKPFTFWTLGLCVLVFAGIAKFTGMEAAGESMRSVLDALPKIALAAFGGSNVDLFSFSGYFAILAFFALVCVAIYSSWLGGAAVSRETVDKTAEFIFTKPRSRSYILTAKFAAELTYLTGFCAAFCVFSLVSAKMVGADAVRVILLYTAACFVTGLAFFALSAFLSALFIRAEAGARAANLAVLAAYGFSVVYDMLDTGAAAFIRSFAIFKYFPGAEMAEGKFSLPFLALALIIAAAALAAAYACFNKKDIYT